MNMSGQRVSTEGLRLAERIVAVLHEGRKTSTYKFAVLLGLMDLCMEFATRSGAAPTMVTTRQLAEKVTELYWPQTRLYDRDGEGSVLLQNASSKGSQAEIISNICTFRHKHAPDATASIHKSRGFAPRRYKVLVDQVERTLIRYPLPRVQYIGNHEKRFIYDIAWTREDTEGRSTGLLSSVRDYQRGLESPFDNRIHLQHGVGDSLVLLNGILRPLIHALWADKVAKFNDLDRLQLQAFLFHQSRTCTKPLRAGLWDLQSGECLFCGTGIRRASDAVVDHFIPWVRYASDDLSNLVAAHGKCNGAKKDYLAASRHLGVWRSRFEAGADLQSLADATSWEYCPDRVLAMARSVYLHLPEESPLWVANGDFEDSCNATLVGLLCA